MSTAALKRVVVVGNGIAGLTTTDTLREAGFDGTTAVAMDYRVPAPAAPQTRAAA
ncbi:hypothetical protein [Streptomyces sp. A1277]|uniref:hypothetical protein n=1 Tax=Streptomyces sp. A1277 TaxID=2563103 RepID=UPI0014461B24|nr:hypothetical protein [Streptomyces sp. A1277]